MDMLSARDQQAIREAFRRGDEEDAYWTAHYAELLKQYPEQYVAVDEGQVIATHPDPLELHRLLKAKGLEPRQVWVKLITAHPRYLIL
jgi:hypothetical protein